MTTQIFAGSKGTGKTRKLLELAEKYNAIVISPFKSALQVKAQALGYNLTILNFNDYFLNYNEKYLGRKIVVDNASEVLAAVVNYQNNGNELIGITVDN